MESLRILDDGFRQKLPVDAAATVWYGRSMVGELENEFSITRAALSTSGRAKSKFLSKLIHRNRKGVSLARALLLGPLGIAWHVLAGHALVGLICSVKLIKVDILPMISHSPGSPGSL